MCPPNLFVYDNVGQILQYRVRGDGKNAGSRLSLSPHWLQGQDLLTSNSSALDELISALLLGWGCRNLKKCGKRIARARCSNKMRQGTGSKRNIEGSIENKEARACINGHWGGHSHEQTNKREISHVAWCL